MLLFYGFILIIECWENEFPKKKKKKERKRAKNNSLQYYFEVMLQGTCGTIFLGVNQTHVH